MIGPAIARIRQARRPNDLFPAQRIHLERDRPREAADLVIANDPRRKPVPAPNPGGPDRIERGAGPEFAGPPGCRATVAAWFEGTEGVVR